MQILPLSLLHSLSTLFPLSLTLCFKYGFRSCSSYFPLFICSPILSLLSLFLSHIVSFHLPISFNSLFFSLFFSLSVSIPLPLFLILCSFLFLFSLSLSLSFVLYVFSFPFPFFLIWCSFPYFTSTFSLSFSFTPPSLLSLSSHTSSIHFALFPFSPISSIQFSFFLSSFVFCFFSLFLSVFHYSRSSSIHFYSPPPPLPLPHSLPHTEIF